VNATVKPTGITSIFKSHLGCRDFDFGLSCVLRRTFFVLFLLGSVVPDAGRASVPIGQICDQAAQIAATESNVPVSVLRSITRTETGRTHAGSLQPWPWTVNMEGVGKWFDTEDAARAYVFKHFKRGARSFDVGCFQINYRWHGQAFRSIDEMFDPVENARYAASFLSELHAETGNWSKAAGAYHSRTPKFATRYRARFDDIRQTMEAPHSPPPATVVVTSQDSGDYQLARINRYPLLQQVSHQASRGSLVPLGQATSDPMRRSTQGALISFDNPRMGLVN